MFGLSFGGENIIGRDARRIADTDDGAVQRPIIDLLENPGAARVGGNIGLKEADLTTMLTFQGALDRGRAVAVAGVAQDDVGSGPHEPVAHRGAQASAPSGNQHRAAVEVVVEFVFVAGTSRLTAFIQVLARHPKSFVVAGPTGF